MSWKTVMGVALMVMGAAAAEAKTSLWLHIKVREGEEGRVSINLPLSVVEAATPLLPEDARTATRLRIDGQELSVSDLRRIWREARSRPEGTFVTVDDSNGTVRVGRQGAHLLIRAIDAGSHHGDRVEVRIPAAVVDALLSGAGDRLNLAAGVEALAATGEGELVTVNGANETVHMWVDGDADGR